MALVEGGVIQFGVRCVYFLFYLFNVNIREFIHLSLFKVTMFFLRVCPVMPGGGAFIHGLCYGIFFVRDERILAMH